MDEKTVHKRDHTNKIVEKFEEFINNVKEYIKTERAVSRTFSEIVREHSISISVNIEDGGLKSISENLAVIFYHKKPQESFHYIDGLEDSFPVFLAQLTGMRLRVLRMSTKESSTEAIVRTILDAVINYPNSDTFSVVQIVYKNIHEKEAIMSGIKVGLSDPKTTRLMLLIRP